MSERKVTVPGRGHFMFPSSMTDDEIKGVFKRKYPEWYTKPDPEAGAERKALRLGPHAPEQPAPAQAPGPKRTVTQEEADTMPLSAFANVERIKRKDGDDLLWNAGSSSFRRKSVIDTDNRRKDLIPEVVAQLPKELDDVAQKALEPFKGTEHIPVQARNAAQHVTKAKARYLMGQLGQLGDLIDAEEERIKKARQMDAGGKVAFDEWDRRGYAGLIEEYNFRREALAKQFRGENAKAARKAGGSTEDWNTDGPGMMYHVRKAAPGLFGDPDALEGEPYHKGILGAIPMALHETGKVSKLGFVTIAETMRGFQTGDWTDVGRNLRAWQENPEGPLPFDRDVASLSYKNEFWEKATGTVLGAGAEMLPFVGAFAAARALGVGVFSKAAMAGRTGLAVDMGAGAAMMGFNDDGSPNLMGLAIGMGLPGVGRLGGQLGGKAADKYLVGQWNKTKPLMNELQAGSKKALDYPWLSPGGKAMTANGISRAKFLNDYSALLRGRWEMAGGLAANSLYLAALQTPGVLYLKDANGDFLRDENGDLVPNPNAYADGWDAVFNYLPWVLYGLKPVKMPKGIAPQTIEALIKVGYRRPLLEIETMLPRVRPRLTTEGVEPGVGTSRIYIDPFPKGVLEGEPGGRSPVIRMRQEKPVLPSQPDPLIGLPETGSRRAPVPRGPGGVEGTLVPPAGAPRGLPYTPPRQPIPVPPRGLPSEQVITPPAPVVPLVKIPDSVINSQAEATELFSGRSEADITEMLAEAGNDYGRKTSNQEFFKALKELGYLSTTRKNKFNEIASDIFAYQAKVDRALASRPPSTNIPLSMREALAAQVEYMTMTGEPVLLWNNKSQAKADLAKLGLLDHLTLDSGGKGYPDISLRKPKTADLGGNPWDNKFQKKMWMAWDNSEFRPVQFKDAVAEQPPAEALTPVDAEFADLGGKLTEAFEQNDFGAIDEIRQEVILRGGTEEDFNVLSERVEQELSGEEASPEEMADWSKTPGARAQPEVTGPPAGVVTGAPAPLLGLQKGKSMDAQYALAPMSQLQASHVGEAYSKNEAFAPLRNTRDYAKNQAEKEKVLKVANEFDPAQYAQLAKGAETGPIMVSLGSDGVLRVMGGNGRFQAISRLTEEQRRNLRDAGNKLGEQFGLPENASTDQLLVRLLPPHDVSTKEGIAAANEVIDILNPSAGLIESAESMALADAVTLSADEVLRVVGRGNLKEQQLELKALIGHGRLDTNTRTRVTQKASETADYVRALKVAAAYGPEHGALLADFAKLALGQPNIGVTYTHAIESPAVALLEMRTRGHAGLSDAFGELMARVVDLKKNNLRDGILKQLDTIWAQSELIETDDFKAAKMLAFAARQEIRTHALTSQDRVNSGKAGEALEGLWEKVSTVVYGSAQAGEGMLFEDSSIHHGLANLPAALKASHEAEYGAFESEVARIDAGGADPRVLRLNELYQRLKLHEASQLKKSTADRKPVPQKLHDEILEIESALGQEFMGFFKETKLREEVLAKKKAEHDALKEDFRKTDKPTLPITDIQQGFMFNEPGAQMGLFESESAQMLPWEDVSKLRGLKAADPFTLREGTEVEALFDTDGLSDWMDANNLTEEELAGLGQVTHFRREAGEMQMTVEFESGTPVVLEYRGHDPIDPGQLKLLVHQRGVVKDHERILGPKEAEAEGIQKVLELGDRRPLPPPPERNMIRVREDLMPKRTNPDWLRDVTEAPERLKGKGVVGKHVAQKFPMLRSHQRDSANRAIDEMQEGEGHFMLASGAGSGKTMVELAVAAHFAEQFPDEYVMIVTKAAIRETTFAKDAEIMGVKIYEFGGKPPEADKRIYVGTYEDIQAGKIKKSEFKTIILDEAHFARNILLPGKGKTAKGTDRMVSGADRVMYATATPLDKPEQIFFYRRLFDVSPERALLRVGLELAEKGGVTPVKETTQEQIEEGLERLWEQVFGLGRAVKDEVPMDNTEVAFTEIKLTPKDVKYVSDKFRELEIYHSDLEPAQLERLKKIMGRKYLERVKMPYVIENAKRIVAKGHKVVVFAERVAGESTVGSKEGTLSAYKMQLEQEGYIVAGLFGNLTAGEKATQVAKFQQGAAQICLATFGSGGTGISLDDVYGDAPRETIMVTPPYSALLFVQAMARTSRMTTRSKNSVWVPLTTHWVDRHGVDIVGKKLRNLRSVVSGDIKQPKGKRPTTDDTMLSEIAEYVPEEKIPYKILEAQKRAGEQAAVLGAFLDSVATEAARAEVRRVQSTGAGLHTANLIASLDFDHSQVGVAYLTGKKVRHLSEVAAAFTLTRSPFAEGLKITVLDSTGQAIADDWIGYGTPKSTPSFDVEGTASRYKDMGAAHVIMTHNESNGQDVATHSPADQAMIERMNKIIPTTGLVTDHRKFAVLEAGKEVRYEELPKEAQGEFFGYKTSEGVPKGLMGRQLANRNPNTGSLMLSPDMVAMAMHEATGGKNFAHSLGVALMGPQGHLKAMLEFGDPSLLSTPEGVNHLRKIARANGAVTAVGVYNGEPLYDSKHYEVFSELTKNGVLEEVLGYTGEMPASMRNRVAQRDDLGNHIMGVPRDSWNEFQSEVAEYDPEGVPNQTGLEYNIKDPSSGKVTKVPVPLGGMEHVKPLKMVWAVKLFETIMGKRPKATKITRKVKGFVPRGYFAPATGDVVIDIGVFKDEAEAAKVLWHEIGHWTDWMDEGTLARGNVIGRLKSLRSFLKGKFGELKDKELREELKEVTLFWHPWDRSTASPGFIKYRDSAVELYADALSVLFNDPALLQKMAPNFYTAFFQYIDAKPKLSRELIDLWETLDHDYTGAIQERIENSLEEYAQADAIIKMRATEARERRKYWKNWWDYLSYGLNYRHSKLEKKLVEAKKAGYDPTVETDPRVLIEESLWVADNKNTTFLKKSFEVVKELEAAGVEQDILGKWMELERIIYERSTLANPGGITPLAAKEQMIVLRNQLGAKTAGLIENWALPRLHDLFFEVAEEAMHEGIINAKTFKKVIEPNKRYYVPFAVQKYLMATMPATVKHQIGTFEKIGNPFTAWIMKAVAMNNFIAVQKAKRTMRDFLTEHFGEDSIQKAPTKKLEIPRNQRHPDAYPFHEIPIKHPDWGIVAIFENGRPVHYYVDPLIAKGFNGDTPSEIQAVTGWFSQVFQNYLYPIFITYNAGFHSYNLIRDFGRSRRTLKLGRVKMAVEYQKALGAAMARLKDVDNDIISEMMANMAIGPLSKKHEQHVEETSTTASQLAQYGLIEPEPLSFVQKLEFTKIGKALANMGDLFEALPKISSYQYLKEYTKKTPREESFIVRNYVGTPHTRRRGGGAWFSSAKALIPFWNVFKEGMKADAELARGTVGHVGSEPSGKERGTGGKSKAYREWGWEKAKSAAGWWWWYAKVHGIYAAIQGLASGGFLGEDAEDLYDGISEYDKTNYMVIPIGKYSGGDYGERVGYIRIPRDFASQLISGLVYKATRQFGDNPQPFHEALGYTTEQGPARNPIITIPHKWLDYVSGRNPEDGFRDRPILNRTEEKLRGMAGAKKMMHWTANQVGARDYFNFFMPKDEEPVGGVMGVLTVVPVMNRFFKVSDSGYREQQWAKLGEKERATLIQRELHAEPTKDALREYYTLGRLKTIGLTPEQTLRHFDLSDWHRDTYTPLNDEIKSMDEFGSKKEAQRLRNALGELTELLLESK